MVQELKSGSGRRGSAALAGVLFVVGGLTFMAPQVIPGVFSSVNEQTAQLISASIACLLIAWGLYEVAKIRKV